MSLSQFTQSEIEQYYRIRLDRAGFHHVKGNEWRSRCILHGGDNPNSLWVDIATGGFCCFSCQKKGGGIYSFEQEVLRGESASGQAPETGKVTESIHTVLGTPFVSRVYQEDIPTKAKGTGWDRKQAQDYYVYQDELGRELYRVWRFVDRSGNKVTPPDHACACQRNPDAECEAGCVDGRVWGAKDVRRVLYRLPDVIQSSFCFIVEGEKDVNNLSRALALYISRKEGFKLANLLLDRVSVTTNMGGSSGWKPEYEYGKYFTGKVVVKLGDNDAPGRLHDAAVCKDVAKYALQLYTLELPVKEKEDISDYLKNHTIEDLIKLMETSLKKWAVAKAKETKVGEKNEPRIVLVHPVELTGRETKPTCDWLVEGLIERGQRGLVIAPPKVGKAQPVDSSILTPNGWVRMGDIKPGDKVIGSNGRPTNVLAVHPQGIVQTYEVAISGGVVVETCADHLWKIQSHDDRIIGKWRVKTTAQIADEISQGKDRWHYLPIVKPIEHEDVDFDIPPYSLGFMIGDGCFRVIHGITITTADEDCAQRVGEECDGITKNHSHLYTYGVKLKFSRRRLEALGLYGKMSSEKHIPAEYMRGSVSQRLDLLRGLLDSDGCFEAGKLVTFSSTSRTLAGNVQELAESLGGTAVMKSKDPFYRLGDGSKKQCLTAYTLVIKLPRELGNPFFCKRKAAKWEASTTGTKKIPCRRIVAVRKGRMVSAQCISIDATDSLYVTNNHVLTHNSLMFLDMVVSLASTTRFLGVDPYYRPVKSAIISREDGPELVKRRLTQLAAGRGLSLEDVNANILVNTVKQSSSFHIDSQKELEEMAEWLKAGKVEFCVIDVLNRLHFQNENSTDDMTKVMIKFDELAALSGAQICVIHHLGRTGNSRGSTTIEGWADFICKLEQDPIDESLKTVTIKTKSRGSIEPRSVKYWQSDDKTQSRILLVTKIDKQSNNGNGRDH